MSNLLSIRNLAALLFCIVFFVLLYYYNESLDTLVTVERDKDKCQQNLDTLSAQLQVVYEHKSRLEKSLQAEKENAAKSKREQDRLLSGLQKKSDGFKKQFDSLRTEYETLQQRFMQVKTEKENFRSDSDRRLHNLKSEIENDKENLKKAMEDLNKAQDENSALRSRIDLLEKQNTQNFSNVNHSSANNEKRNAHINYSLENAHKSDRKVDSNIPKQTDVVNSQLAQPIPANTLNDDKQQLSDREHFVSTGDEKHDNGTENNRYSNAILSNDVNAVIKNNYEIKNLNPPKRNSLSFIDRDVRENEQDQVLEAPVINAKSKRFAQVNENRAAENIKEDSESAIQIANDDDFHENQIRLNISGQ